MNGLELARGYFEEFGRPMLERDFPELMDTVAAGLVGEGSECFGYDDEISRDHDFEPGFCLFIPDGENVVDTRTEFRLERAYAALPKEYMGVKRQKISPVGGNRHGVIRVGDFYKRFIGSPDGLHTLADWASVPEHFLAAATNGEVFFDGAGVFSAIRENISAYPDDVFYKKLAGSLLLAAQSGQYNYPRCLSHGETGAAALAMGEFVRHAMQCVFLLNRRYMPYYKWSFRALRGLPDMASLSETFEFLLTSDNSPDMAEIKRNAVEDVASELIARLSDGGMTDAICGDLEKHAYSVNDRVADPGLRNANVLALVR